MPEQKKLPKGTYTVSAIPNTYETGESAKKGTPYVMVELRVEGHKEPLIWRGYLGDESMDWTLSALKKLGASFPTGDIDAPSWPHEPPEVTAKVSYKGEFCNVRIGSLPISEGAKSRIGARLTAQTSEETPF